MKINNLNKLPQGYESYKLSNLDGETGEIPSFVKELWYWYGEHEMEGVGQILMQTKDDKFHLCDLGHGSDETPTHALGFGGGESLDEIEASLSDEYKKDECPLYKKQDSTQWQVNKRRVST